MDDPFSPAGRFDERRRQADQQRALEVKVKREQEASMGIVERLRDPVNNWNSGGRFAAADLIERLKGYAEHQLLCPADFEGPCSCGLTALIKEIERD